ncbi:hypothetical protein SERLA73DRAFT_185149 [Serpula lacrymans var. lacrymans S7.3]|uniref:Uncharacterized protein n=1 Tax=Serpula lacrymans var. lacrymans (strain S7.3) TaxID=936435 RepID=F8Q446_SERL3|nr:hypothetical protein SERLA73DRAFT_185149 [Serpula lacrymans var. lacrymans S7.3]
MTTAIYIKAYSCIPSPNLTIYQVHSKTMTIFDYVVFSGDIDRLKSPLAAL